MTSTEEALNEAVADAKLAKSAVTAADGKKAQAAAELDAMKALTVVGVANAAAVAAQAHAAHAGPVDALEDKATKLQVQAEVAREKADTLKATGVERIAHAQRVAAAAVMNAETLYDETLTDIENGVRSVMGV